MRWHLIPDRTVVLGALGLVVSLFLTWSHQLPRALLAEPGAGIAFQGVPRDPTGWQVYSAADVLLALLAAGLVAAVIVGRRRPRVVALLGIATATAFVAHAVAVPPTNGATLLNTRAAVPSYLASMATAGAGETVALASLAIAAVGLGAGLVEA
jgi:hypothetical protein